MADEGSMRPRISSGRLAGTTRHREHLTRRELFPSDPGQLFPVYHVFRAIAPFSGGESVWITIPRPFEVGALAVTKDGNVRLLVANLTEFDQEITLEGVAFRGTTMAVLDETTYEHAAVDPDWLASAMVPLGIEGGRATFQLKPYAVAFLDGEMVR